MRCCIRLRFSTREIHILVYDHEKHQRVDMSTICYDEETDSLKMIKENWTAK